jgi:hypothetical protein
MPQCLTTGIGQAFSGFPLAARQGFDGAANDLGNVRHHRQRQPERCLYPVRQGNRKSGNIHLERQQEHREEKQNQPWRVAEELGHEPRKPAQSRIQRYLAKAEADADNGPDGHRHDGYQQIEPEPLEQQRHPAQQCVERGQLSVLRFGKTER